MRGIYPICPTPFFDSGDVDYDGLDRLVDWYAACGVGGLVSLGVFGEAAKLAPDEGKQGPEARHRPGRAAGSRSSSAPAICAFATSDRWPKHRWRPARRD